MFGFQSITKAEMNGFLRNLYGTKSLEKIQVEFEHEWSSICLVELWPLIDKKKKVLFGFRSISDR